MKLLAVVLLVASSASATVFGFVGFAAWSEAQHQCPGGSDCPDATFVATEGAIVVLISLVIGGLAARKLLQ